MSVKLFSFPCYFLLLILGSCPQWCQLHRDNYLLVYDSGFVKMLLLSFKDVWVQFKPKMKNCHICYLSPFSPSYHNLLEEGFS